MPFFKSPYEENFEVSTIPVRQKSRDLQAWIVFLPKAYMSQINCNMR